MGRKRKPTNIRPWDIITDSLADLMSGFRIHKTSRDFFKVSYYRNTMELRKHCTRILNVLDSMDSKGDKDGLITKTGRTKVPTSTDSGDGGDRD